MREPRILIADNDRHFLGALADYLDAHGLFVESASSLEVAQRYLEDDWFHLAILDIRLVDDCDEKDLSGLDLAKRVAPSVPKVILTSFPSWQVVRESLGSGLGAAAAVAFAAKQEGVDAVLEQVRSLLAGECAINWALTIAWQPEGCLTLLKVIDPIIDLASDIASREGEMEDMFRRIFMSASHLRIGRILWRRRGYVAMVVFVYEPDNVVATFVVICGVRSAVVDHERAYRHYSGTARLIGVPKVERSGQTTHFAATVFACAGDELEAAMSLEELYREASEKQFRDALKVLDRDVLSGWRRNMGIVEDRKTVSDILSCSYPDVGQRIMPGQFEQILDALGRHSPSLGIRIAQSHNTVTIQFDGDKVEYPSPAKVLQGMAHKRVDILVGYRPAVIAGDSVYFNAPDKLWTTELVGVAYIPLVEEYVTLEALVRYDWCVPANVRDIHEFEVVITSGEFNVLPSQDVQAPFRRALRVIEDVRRMSRKVVGDDHYIYYLGMLCSALRRIPLCTGDTQWTRGELMKACHALLSSLVLAERIGRSDLRVVRDETAHLNYVVVDRSQGVARIGSRQVRLHGQSLALLCVLEDACGNLCTRQDLIEKVFGVTFDQTDASQVSRLNTAIRRLREKMETDPDRPRYIVTEPGGGYRLVVPTAGEHPAPLWDLSR